MSQKAKKAYEKALKEFMNRTGMVKVNLSFDKLIEANKTLARFDKEDRRVRGLA